MRTSVTWINDYLDRPATAEEQADLLTAAGLNFDGGDVAENGERWQEIETTSNRGDCLSHVGLARELCAMSGRTLKAPVPANKAAGSAASKHVAVTNEDTAACPRYTARVIRDVRVGPSPEWLQRRLRAIGQIPRNNLVDCTNFVLFELGQPTHVFDLDRLKGARIQVRRAKKGERFLPIGEGAQETELAGGELVIADAERPVAIAGVKGGALTAVTDVTTNVLIEAATFAPAAVRAASRGLKIASDSSYRFERGVHPSEIDAAAERLVQLILETAGGTLCDGSVEAGAPLPSARRVSVRPARVRAILGTEIPLEEIVRALETLGFSPVVRGDAVDCSVPPRRLDIEREVDIIEEICRIHGLDRIPLKEKLPVRVAPVSWRASRTRWCPSATRRRSTAPAARSCASAMNAPAARRCCAHRSSPASSRCDAATRTRGLPSCGSSSSPARSRSTRTARTTSSRSSRSSTTTPPTRTTPCAGCAARANAPCGSWPATM
jgi:phenylalanyl-tRNA synthetase beta chain